MERGLHVAVAGIPKTIDNDVDYIVSDRELSRSVAVMLIFASSGSFVRVHLVCRGRTISDSGSQSRGILQSPERGWHSETHGALAVHVDFVQGARTKTLHNMIPQGRSSGFIAAHATLGSGDVDLCLVPEVPIVLEGSMGCLPHLWRRVKKNGYAVSAPM